jgi:Cys-rich repeat protein
MNRLASLLALLTLVGLAGVSQARELSLVFNEGYLGTQGTNTNQSDAIKTFATLGIDHMAFIQYEDDETGDGLFGGAGTQGNDLDGTIRIALTNGTRITLNGALNFRETTGSKVEVFGFIFAEGQNASITYGGGLTYNILGGSTPSTSTSLGLKALTSTFTFTDGQNRSGNAATSGLLSALNDYLLAVPQPSAVVASPPSVVEGNTLVYTVSLSKATTFRVTYLFSLSGVATADSDYLTSQITLSNGVVLDNDGTISVPSGVSSFTVTVPTLDDESIEEAETLILNIGAVKTTGHILDNDGVTNPPALSDAAVYTAVGTANVTFAPSTVYLDVDGDPIATVTVIDTDGLDASWNAVSGLLTVSDAPSLAAGVYHVRYEVCDTSELCDTATLTVTVNDPPELLTRSVASGFAPSVAFNGQTTVAFADYFVDFNLVKGDDPTDGDADGIRSVKVAASAAGPFGASANLGGGVSCTVDADRGIGFVVGTTETAKDCFVEVCEELPAGSTAVCAVTTVGVRVVQCLIDSQCPGGFCDLDGNVCVQCLSDANCDDGNACTSDRCADGLCANTTEQAGTLCPGGVCDGAPSDPECVECVADAQCPGGRCDTATNTCVECLGAADCNDGNACTRDVCAAGLCANPSELAGTECPGGVCDVSQAPVCVECINDGQCPGGRCDVEANVCVECLSGADCADGNACTDDLCVDGLCGNPSRPAESSCEGGVCDGAFEDPRCVECVTDGQCPGERCDVNANVCVQCVTNADCDDGNACTADSCVDGVCGNTSLERGTMCPEGVCDGAETAPKCLEEPRAVDDVVVSQEDQATLIYVLANDRGTEDGDLVLDSLLSEPLHGTVTVNPDGSLTYVPNPDFSGVDFFRYLACLPNGLCAEATVVIGISEQQDPPEAKDDRLPTPKDTPVTIPVRGNDVDPDGDGLLAPEIVAQPESGTVTVDENGNIVFTPAPGSEGPVTFTYKVCDEGGLCDEATVTIQVGDDNGVPEAKPDTATASPGLPVEIDVLGNDSDPDGDALTLSEVTRPAHGRVEIVDGKLVYVPDLDFVGTDTFVYTVCDETACVSATVTVEVEGELDSAPVALDDEHTVVKGQPLEIDDVLDNDFDLDGDALTVVAVGEARHGTVTLKGDGTIVYEPEEGFVGVDAFEVTVVDENGNTTTSTVFVYVTEGAQNAPVAVDDAYDIPAEDDAVLAVRDNDSDADGDVLTVVDIAQPMHGTAVVTESGDIVYTPEPGYTGPDAFSYTVSDGKGGYATAVVTIYVGERDTDGDGLSDAAEEASCSDPNNADSDGDGLEDGVEIAASVAGVYDAGVDTDPCDADTDDDGLSDGVEKNGTGPLEGIGALDPLSPDTDGDGLNDGTELGLVEPLPAGESNGKPMKGSDPEKFVADADPESTTNPLDDDSDDDGLLDGTEDANGNGRVDGTIGGTGDAGSGETDPNDADTDGDGIQDGTESGLTAPEGDDTDSTVFVPDADPESTTDPRDTDSDDGSLSDGAEDGNHNGAVDVGETDPALTGDDKPAELVVRGGACGGGGSDLPWAFALLGMLALGSRRRRV